MASKSSISVIAAAALFIGSTLAQNATTISATGCVDPSSMSSCLSAASTALSTCINEAAGVDAIIEACQWQEWIEEMVCYQASCWNKAYSCEYQYLVSEYKAERLADETIPFYPPPDNAPGGCSCNLGEVFTNLTGSIDAVGNCDQYTTSFTDDLSICQCCAYSAGVSAFYGICPNTSPNGLGLTTFESSIADGYENIAGTCANLTADVCATYGFWSADNGTFLDPANLPSGGTQSLSTTAGPSSLTTPPAGATITWTALSQTFTVTASAYNAKNVAAGSTSTATGTAAAGGSASQSTATTTGAAAATTTSKGAGSSIQGGSGTWAIGLLCLGVVLVAI